MAFFFSVFQTVEVKIAILARDNNKPYFWLHYYYTFDLKIYFLPESLVFTHVNFYLTD